MNSIIMYSIMFILAGIIVLCVALGCEIRRRSYAKCSESIMAKVLSKRSIQANNKHRYEVYVSYVVDGESYKKTVIVSLSEYNKIHEGDSMQMNYKPQNPKRAIRTAEMNPKGTQITFIIGAILLAVGIILYFI